MSDPKSDPVGTVRRALAPSFAHAIKLDQGSAELEWLLVDAYGPLWHDTMLSGDEVKDWPVVYVPLPDQLWATVEYTTRDGCSGTRDGGTA